VKGIFRKINLFADNIDMWVTFLSIEFLFSEDKIHGGCLYTKKAFIHRRYSSVEEIFVIRTYSIYAEDIYLWRAII
jgi:hypothetical protein